MGLMGTVGRFRFEVVEIRAKSVQTSAIPLAKLDGVTRLLATGPSHDDRLAAGDELLATHTPNGVPTGIVWLNRATHVDTYAGALSRPSPTSVYLNQLLVAPEHRGHGLGHELVRGVMNRAHELGKVNVVALVHPSNKASMRVFTDCGGVVTQSLFGVRFGPAGSFRYHRESETS